MYYSRLSGAAPGARYGQIDLAGRIESASSHGLITLLFEELETSIRLVAGCRSGQLQAQALSRSLNILQSLDSSLDFAKGGEIAQTLGRVYQEIRRLLLAGVREGEQKPILDAAAIVGDIAQSWKEIG